ncbi:hypothetical protein IJG29_00120 [Candidatus Saccharibacteria bacterium]|nr:hypothetical protein [Candidatus Saccharibacteria bacterium]
MSSTEVLREAEGVALGETPIISRVTGKQAKNSGSKIKKWGAGGFVTLMILIFVMFFGSGSLIPVAISERLIEETDVQYADAVESKILVFQQALYSGEVPANTIKRLSDSGVMVGQVVDGEFKEGTHGGELALFYNGKVILAKDFVSEVNSNAGLYTAFNNATYTRAAYWYDESAEEVFREIGTSRNNYNADADFNEVMSELLGEGSDIAVNNVVEKEVETEDGKKIEYSEIGETAKSSEAEQFIQSVRNKNYADNENQATLNAADTLNVADTISKEQRSSIFFLAFMENISKMKAGEGNESKINEAMNYLYRSEETEVVDVKTGEVVKVSGSMVESPSLYAVLASERVDVGGVENYSSDRILKTVENLTGSEVDSENLLGTVTSSNGKKKGTIGRFINGSDVAGDAVDAVTVTIDNSLVNNGFSNTRGIAGGELLVEGAVNVGRMLATKSGASSGNAAAVKAYAGLNAAVLALEAEADRMNRSPFDITSKNTFLGSILYRFAIMSAKNSSIYNMFSGIKTLSSVAVKSFGAIFNVAYADDVENGYLTNFGDCKTLGEIGAVGSAGCSAVATFDTSTLNDTFNDSGFIKFVEENTILENGTRVIKSDSALANFIKYNGERNTPIGVTDGGILQNLSNGGVKIPFVSDIVGMIKTYLGASESDKRIATGASFVVSSSNPDWETYKYAQRYVSLARATEALKFYDGDEMAYSNLKFFEGVENPVIAFINQYNNIASH